MRKRFFINLLNVNGKDQLYDKLEEALPLPCYFGRNLDALYDVLTEFGSEWTIEIWGLDEAMERDPYFKKFKRVLMDACEETEGLEIFLN